MQQQVSLKNLNSFRIDAYAKYFSSFDDKDSLLEVLNTKQASTEKLMILGGGSNLLFTKDFDGLLLKNNISGIEKLEENEEYVFIKAGAGVLWHNLVLYCLQHNYGGMENLALIPGSVGASPMQNIGAYGVELKDIFHTLEAVNIHERTTETFNNAACEFGYRNSVFKNKFRDHFIIVSVTYRLAKNPVFNISYGAIKEELDKMAVTDLSIQHIAEAVINIRSSKLPDPAVIGNAGSFFKNPLVSKTIFENLKNSFPGIVGHEAGNEKVKLAAGWLIESCGWKGFRRGDAGCHAKQALVLVNYGNAKGDEILSLSEEIIRSVKQKFNVLLQGEVNIV